MESGESLWVKEFQSVDGWEVGRAQEAGDVDLRRQHSAVDQAAREKQVAKERVVGRVSEKFVKIAVVDHLLHLLSQKLRHLVRAFDAFGQKSKSEKATPKKASILGRESHLRTKTVAPLFSFCAAFKQIRNWPPLFKCKN